ncbi:MAG: hypothetical protein ACYC2T_00970 [Bacillota bacterium]
MKYRNGDEVSDSIGLLISILLRYPEVGTINYEPATRVLKFTFILSHLYPSAVVQGMREKMVLALQTFNFLEGKDPQLIRLDHSICDALTMVEIQRDVDTLAQDELSLIIALMHQEFGDDLVADSNESMQEEELLMQEELIGHMLESIRGDVPEKKLFAFREEGRVLVFNK